MPLLCLLTNNCRVGNKSPLLNNAGATRNTNKLQRDLSVKNTCKGETTVALGSYALPMPYEVDNALQRPEKKLGIELSFLGCNSL